ncbi:MAG TPA: isoprenylcysteine carboxylmethyltransferase family protein [Bryobacteraceae bacterium]|nr:isoprenylcysteine carboxylmethyltransferase family protein [Bryobacteraceae bacterium]
MIFAAGLFLGWCGGIFFPTRWLPTGISQTTGWIIVGLGVALAGWALATFRRTGTTFRPDRPAEKLAIRGPYRFTRNPMYVALTMVYFGLAILLQPIWALLLLPVVLIVLVRRVIGPEERYLERRFGAEYTRYKAQVRRWI